MFFGRLAFYVESVLEKFFFTFWEKKEVRNIRVLKIVKLRFLIFFDGKFVVCWSVMFWDVVFFGFNRFKLSVEILRCL